MQKQFSRIALIGNPRYPDALITHKMLYQWLTDKGYSVIVEQKVAQDLNIKSLITASLEDIGETADLAIVIGGDGNMLSAARVLSHYDIKVIGINRGRLGFLTDLNPDNALQQLSDVLNGQYINEKRFLLEVKVMRAGKILHQGNSVNEVVLHPGKVAHMIDFEVYIDERFAFSQRSDGLIISTPTGSTAYSLSAGGSILVPSLEALTLVPMFPHTLTSRPIVINSHSLIHLRFPNYSSKLELSCDSQVALPVRKGDEVEIHRSQSSLNLIHPTDYNYFNTLSTKLGWSKQFV